MGLARLALTLGSHSNSALCSSPLEELIRDYVSFAYIDKRAKNATLLSTTAGELENRYLELCKDPEAFTRLCSAHVGLRQGMDRDELLKWQYDKVDTNTNKFPDTVLRFAGDGSFGDGALLELKEAAKGSVASFNSTPPVSTKPIGLLGTKKIRLACFRYDLVGSTESEYFSEERLVYYLLRSWSGNANRFLLGLIPGSIFNPHSDVESMKLLLGELLGEAGIKALSADSQAVIDKIAILGRDGISKTRKIEGAKVSMRLRIMTEAKVKLDDLGCEHGFSFLIDSREAGCDNVRDLATLISNENLVATVNGDSIDIGDGTKSVRFKVSIKNIEWMKRTFFVLQKQS